jgi:lysosomal alpha-mannosidase
MVKGHAFLKNEFGVRPRTGWHLDSFGHSSTNARLFADFGFEAQFFARSDRLDKEQKFKDRAMDFLWRPHAKHFGSQKQILTSIFRDHYCWIPDFQVNDQDSFEDDETLESFNADSKMHKFIKYIHEFIVTVHRTNHLILPWGCDFAFQNAAQNYQEMEKVINYVNKHNKFNMKVMMSTPGRYVDALKATNTVWPVYYNDMFPYSDEKNDYWSGYFSSRPSSKVQVKQGSANLHAANLIFAQQVLNPATPDEEVTQILAASQRMLDAMGLFQHHDAVTGTDAEFVAKDYQRRLWTAQAQSDKLYKRAIAAEYERLTGIKPVSELLTCENAANDTVIDCPIGRPSHRSSAEFTVVAHNPASQTASQFVRVRVPDNKYKV